MSMIMIDSQFLHV